MKSMSHKNNHHGWSTRKLCILCLWTGRLWNVAYRREYKHVFDFIWVSISNFRSNIYFEKMFGDTNREFMIFSRVPGTLALPLATCLFFIFAPKYSLRRRAGSAVDCDGRVLAPFSRRACRYSVGINIISLAVFAIPANRATLHSVIWTPQWAWLSVVTERNFCSRLLEIVFLMWFFFVSFALKKKIK